MPIVPFSPGHVEYLKGAIDRLQVELAWYKDNVRCTDEGPCACNYRAVTAEARLASVQYYVDELERALEMAREDALTGEARLAAVIALCDGMNLGGFASRVRAAATGTPCA